MATLGRRVPQHKPLPVRSPSNPLRIHKTGTPRSLHLSGSRIVDAQQILASSARQERQVLGIWVTGNAAHGQGRSMKFRTKYLDGFGSCKIDYEQL